MVRYIGFAIIMLSALICIGLFVVVYKEENKNINRTINNDLKDWSALQCWNYMQDHKHDKFVTEYDRIKYLACKKIIDKRMR